MLKFSRFLEEDVYPLIRAESMNWLESISEINEKLFDLLEDEEFVTPYIAFTSVKQCLTGYGINLPQSFMDNDEGELVFEIETDEEEMMYFLYFSYESTSDGYFTCVAEIIDEDILLDVVGEDDLEDLE